MDALVVGAGGIFAHGYGEDGAIRAEHAVDYGCGGDTDCGSYLSAAVVIAGCFAGGDDGGLPELGSAVGVKGVDAAVLGGNIEDIVNLAGDGEIGQEEWFGIDMAIDGQEADLPELG